MKYSYKEMPEQMKGTFGDFSRNFGFSWKEFVVTVPSPLFLVTTYKANGQPNACGLHLQVQIMVMGFMLSLPASIKTATYTRVSLKPKKPLSISCRQNIMPLV